MKYSLALAAFLVTSANAHATFQYFWPNSTYSTNSCVRTPASNNPEGTLSDTLSCNVNGDIPAASTCTAAAGTVVSVEMHQQPGDRTCTTEAIGGNHDGPTIVYMAKVGSAASALGESSSFFKVAQTGLITADGDTQTYYWATDLMNDNCGKVTFTIPSDIAPGDYLLRAEVIALHVAGQLGGAQHYTSCYQLTVTGGGTKTPAGVSFPGAYSETDPGILWNLYTSYTTYPIPGPTLYTPGSGGAATTTSTTAKTTTTSSSSTKPTTTTSTSSGKTTSTTSTSVKTTTSTTSSKVTTTTSKTTTTSATSTAAAAAQYGQCGGTGWAGATTCVSPYTCIVVNAYYYQCQ